MELTVADAAERLGVTTRQVQHLAARGDIQTVARGLVDATSVARHLAVHATVHRRAWAEMTAWAAVALLSGVAPEWLGASQVSRLRGRLRSLTAAQLVERARNRARVTRYVGHSRAGDRVAAELVAASRASASLGLADMSGVDGYLPVGDVAGLIRRHGLKRDEEGHVILRATSAAIELVEDLAQAGPILAALDLAESLDAREREIGRRVLDAGLGQLRA
ncbi:hypothetical protein ACFQE5_09720 [Pseudonocardia hispaniensis]|uniref:Excisionase family DNA binding protein n=1 Tax=Pseudonocardia hispaniensis TaxID=904933 RepID=A0ABW1J1B4_9PSEU